MSAEPLEPPPTDLDAEEERRKGRLVFYGVAGAAFVAAITYGGTEFGPPGVVLVLTGGALVAVIAAFWTSVRTLIGETRLSGADAFAIGAPREEMEQKRAVLRALKDLEFERSVGKISDDDYVQLSERYRAEAKRLLRQIDLASAEQRDHALQIVNKRLASVGLAPTQGPVAPAFEPMPEPQVAPAPDPIRPAFEPMEQPAPAVLIAIQAQVDAMLREPAAEKETGEEKGASATADETDAASEKKPDA